MVRPLKYTGVRAEQYETLKAFDNVLTKQEINKEIALLNKKELKARERAKKQEAERKKKEKEEEEKFLKEISARVAKQLAEEEKKKEQKRKEALEKKKADNNLVFDVRFNFSKEGNDFEKDVINPLIKALEKITKEKQVYFQVSQKLSWNDDIVFGFKGMITIKGGDAKAIYWNNFYPILFPYDRVGVDLGGKMRFVIIKANKIPSQKIQQAYRDGEKHCVIEPLLNLYNSMIENSTSDASKKRLKQIANKLKAFESIYPDGVPEENMEEIAKTAHRQINIHSIIGDVITTYNKASPKHFHFTNTRANHIEEGYITIDKQYEKVTQEQMDRILYEHDRDDVFYLMTGNNGNIQSIRSVRGCWCIYNEEYDIYNEFSTKHNIKDYGLNAIEYSSLNDFIIQGRLINSAPTPLCDEPNNIDDVNHIDISKAYTQHKFAPYYQGFLGHIRQYAKLPFDIDALTFMEKHLGIYKFSVINCDNELLNKLGIHTGNTYILPSPEIIYFIKDFGVEVKLIAGCWGSRFDIEYDETMLENRRYCIWAGKLGIDKNETVYTFKGNREWASHLKAELGNEKVLYFSDNKLIVVKVPKKSYYTTHHILAGITSYTRMNMIEIMRNIKGDLVKVILDGIYFRGEVPDITIPHKNNKDIKTHAGFRDAWYYNTDFSTFDWNAYDEKLDSDSNVVVLAGAGGTGKSFSVLTNKSIIKPLYVVPSHLLGRKCRNTYNCSYTTIHKLIGLECLSYKEDICEPGVVFVDELTMMESNWIKKALEMYPNTFFFIAGDIDNKQWFQCRNGRPGQFSDIWLPSPNHKVIYYTNDMRSKDDELKNFKEDIRQKMRDYFTDGCEGDAKRLNDYVKNAYKTVDFWTATTMFKPGDYWIAGTHETNSQLLKLGIVSGYINKDKELVQKEEKGAIIRGSFTTHSFQGLTIDTERVFISLDFFEYAMLYTSISRVRNFKQIVLVN